MKTYKQFIDGHWVPSTSRRTFATLNPATGKPLARFPQGTEKDVDRAVEAAKKALPSWSDLPAPHRGEILMEISRLLKRHKPRLGRLVTPEMGKVLKEALGDVQEAIDVFEYMAGEGRQIGRASW